MRTAIGTAIGLVLWTSPPASADDTDAKIRGNLVQINSEDHRIDAEGGVGSAGGENDVSSGVESDPPPIQCPRPDGIDLPVICGGAEPSADQPSVLASIRRAVREIPMPPNELVVQPPGGTLVNVPAIFHTRAQTFRESVTLLGHTVDVEATPSRFTWHHGDGTSHSTASPGRPYPAKDVTHTYTRAAESLAASVDTTYTVRYRVDGGAWSDLDGTLTATGPTTPVSVDEAAPVLVRP